MGRLREESILISFETVHETNLARCKRWHPGFPNDGWTGADWSNAVAGEVGELCNVVKKLRRSDMGIVGKADSDRATLMAMLANEMADVFLYLDLLSSFYGVHLPSAIAGKFDAVSRREGWPERLGPMEAS